MFAFLVDVPNWAIYAIVGGVLGASAAPLGALLAKIGIRLGRFLPVAAIALTAPVTRTVVMPSVETARVIKQMNTELPKAVDEVTTLRKVELESGVFTYHFDLADSVPAETDVQSVKLENLAGMCSFWRDQFASGDISMAVYEYRLHGRTQTFVLFPSDC